VLPTISQIPKSCSYGRDDEATNINRRNSYARFTSEFPSIFQMVPRSDIRRIYGVESESAEDRIEAEVGMMMLLSLKCKGELMGEP